MARILIALFLAAQSFAANAQTVDCGKAETQSDLNYCADQAYRKSDAALNDLYKEITGRLKDDAATEKLLVAAQRAWIAFRDAECTFATSESATGSVYPMLVTQCRDGLTSKRIEDLKSYLACGEGDLSCPVPPGN